MPRLARLDAPGVLHHVMGRGIEGRKIYRSTGDYNDFIDRLSRLADDNALDVYAWALLPNHFHLLVKTKNRPLSSSMRKLLTGYVVNHNKRYRRNGHLFQNRYKSIVCQEDTYLLELVRYIHLNLLRSGLAKNLEELTSSPLSGHSALMGKIKREWQNTDYVLSYFGSKRVRRRNYLQYIAKGVDAGRKPELVGGGLIRSLGGWSEVIAARGKKERHAFDSRILGDSGFVNEIKSDIDEMIKRNLRLSDQQIDLEELCKRVCQKNKVSLPELCTGSRRREITDARRTVAWIAVRELGYSGAEVARHLGVTSSCITRFLSSGQQPDIAGLLKS